MIALQAPVRHTVKIIVLKQKKKRKEKKNYSDKISLIVTYIAAFFFKPYCNRSRLENSHCQLYFNSCSPISYSAAFFYCIAKGYHLSRYFPLE